MRAAPCCSTSARAGAHSAQGLFRFPDPAAGFSRALSRLAHRPRGLSLACVQVLAEKLSTGPLRIQRIDKAKWTAVVKPDDEVLVAVSLKPVDQGWQLVAASAVAKAPAAKHG